MLKLIKYEIRKMRTGLLIALGVLPAMELFFLLRFRAGGQELPMIMVLMWGYGFLGTIIYTVFRGPTLYGKELKEKSSYLLFMTPNSALKILSAKVLTGLLLSAAFAGLYIAALKSIFMMLDEINAQYGFGELAYIFSFADTLTGGEATYWIGIGVLMAAATFMSTTAAIYFSETLSATILRGKKGRGGLTLLFWCMTTTVIGRLNEWCWGLEQGLVPLPLILHLIIGAAGIWGSALLLERKVSL